jgi:hypothetical protein
MCAPDVAVVVILTHQLVVVLHILQTRHMKIIVVIVMDNFGIAVESVEVSTQPVMVIVVNVIWVFHLVNVV